MIVWWGSGGKRGREGKGRREGEMSVVQAYLLRDILACVET